MEFTSTLRNDLKLNAIKKEVANLEVRLNTKGFLNSSSFEKDKEIWETINDIYTYTSFKKLKQSEILTTFRRRISFLLKMDWERSKNETTGNNNTYKIYTYTTIILITCAIFYSIFEELFTLNPQVDLLVAFTMFIISLFFSILITIINTKNSFSSFNFILITIFLIINSFVQFFALIQTISYFFMTVQFNKHQGYYVYDIKYLIKGRELSYTIFDKTYNKDSALFFDLLYGSNTHLFFLTSIVLIIFLLLILKQKEYIYIKDSLTNHLEEKSVIHKLNTGKDDMSLSFFEKLNFYIFEEKDFKQENTERSKLKEQFQFDKIKIKKNYKKKKNINNKKQTKKNLYKIKRKFDRDKLNLEDNFIYLQNELEKNCSDEEYNHKYMILKSFYTKHRLYLEKDFNESIYLYSNKKAKNEYKKQKLNLIKQYYSDDRDIVNNIKQKERD